MMKAQVRMSKTNEFTGGLKGKGLPIKQSPFIEFKKELHQARDKTIEQI